MEFLLPAVLFSTVALRAQYAAAGENTCKEKTHERSLSFFLSFMDVSASFSLSWTSSKLVCRQMGEDSLKSVFVC